MFCRILGLPQHIDQNKRQISIFHLCRVPCPESNLGLEVTFLTEQLAEKDPKLQFHFCAARDCGHLTSRRVNTVAAISVIVVICSLVIYNVIACV
jgi:hypothetical protein